MPQAMPGTIRGFVQSVVAVPGYGVNSSFEYTDTAHPAMEEIKRVETDLEQADKGVVPSGEKDQRDHVDNTKHTGSASQLCNYYCDFFVSVRQDTAIDDIAERVQAQEDAVKSAGQCTAAYDFRKLAFAIMTLTAK